MNKNCSYDYICIVISTTWKRRCILTSFKIIIMMDIIMRVMIIIKTTTMMRIMMIGVI